jgi:hypothetical protein
MRRKEDAPLVRQPGPPKVKPPDFGRIERDIKRLSHRQNRTQGTGRLICALWLYRFKAGIAENGSNGQA